MKIEKGKYSKAEIDKEIKEIKAVWGIEGMGMTDEEEKLHRAFLAGEITKKEYESNFLVKEN